MRNEAGWEQYGMTSQEFMEYADRAKSTGLNISRSDYARQSHK